jgi:hypothetical protein
MLERFAAPLPLVRRGPAHRARVAFPLSSDRHAGWEVRLSSVWTRSFWQEPDDVARGRAGAAPSTIFGWP